MRYNFGEMPEQLRENDEIIFGARCRYQVMTDHLHCLYEYNSFIFQQMGIHAIKNELAACIYGHGTGGDFPSWHDNSTYPLIPPQALKFVQMLIRLNQQIRRRNARGEVIMVPNRVGTAHVLHGTDVFTAKRGQLFAPCGKGIRGFHPLLALCNRLTESHVDLRIHANSQGEIISGGVYGA